MVEKIKHPIRIDLNQFKLHIGLKNRIELTLHFNSPSRRFYLSVIAFVVNEMKKLGRITSIPLEGHLGLLALLNESVGGSAGSSDKENLLPRIYRKWKDALPNLEDAPLFKVLGRKKEYDEGIGKTYPFTETVKDGWANLFEYKGSEENVRLKFAIDKIGANLNDIVIIYEDSLNADAWERFVSSLKKKIEDKPEAEHIDRVLKEPESPVSPPRKWKIPWPSRYRWATLIATIGVIVGAVTLVIWKTYFKPTPGKVASMETMAFSLPDKPSIAVLPFVNISGDPKEEYFSDGLTEEIITALSKVPHLFVIARQSTFTYKNKPVKVKQISEELGVRYVLEGSVRKTGDKVRISAQLVDAMTGHHLWADRYDRDLRDIFAIQDEITMKIITALQVKLTIGEVAHVWAKGTKNLEAYTKVIQAHANLTRQTKEGVALGRKLSEEAITLDPKYSRAYFTLAQTHLLDILLGETESYEKSLTTALEFTKKAIALDESDADSHSLLAYIYTMMRQHDEALREAERALALNPNSYGNALRLGFVLRNADRAEEAIVVLKSSRRLSPTVTLQAYFFNLAAAYHLTGQHEEAVKTATEGLQQVPNNILLHLQLAATCSMMGSEKEARTAAAEVLKINPKFSLERYVKTLYFKNQADIDRTLDALRKAGLK
jgi:adenylate cyclase